MTLHLDIHIIQSVPPSNINRDDTGSPKSATYGGVRRARVSSQAWKRAVREDFSLYLDSSKIGVRTKRAVELLSDRIMAITPELESADAEAKATAVLAAGDLKVKTDRRNPDGPDVTEYLMFYSNSQLDRLAELALREEKATKKDVKAAIGEGNSIDIALFGRMVANAADFNVDASCQVAHAISTHAIATEFDYYTAVDDENPEEETGAGMIGTIEFNSATLYRYATVNVDQLLRHLGDIEATAQAVSSFVQSFSESMPRGKQNSFANRTKPEAIIVMARSDQPASLVGAFEEAVPQGDGGYVRASCERLAQYARDLESAYEMSPDKTWVSRVGPRTESVSSLGDQVSLPSLTVQVHDYVTDTLSQS